MYRDFYGFTGRPFQLIPDLACYFESRSQQRALTCLSHGLAQSEGFIVLTGEVGVGKTTLIAQLLTTIDQDQVTIARMVGDHLVRGHPADGQFGRGQTIPAVARAFGVVTDLVPGLAAEIHHPFMLEANLSFLRDEVRAGRRCLLVVDEAQALPIAALDALRLMSDFHLGDRALLQILLVGQPELRSRLQGHPELEQLRQRVVAAHHLDPLEADEVERYVHHRLTCVGWTGNPDFAAEIHAELTGATGGIPRRINQIADRLLLLGAVRQQTRIDGAVLAQVLAEWTGLAASEGEKHAFPGPGLKTRLEAALARCEGQIAELQQAIIELEDKSGRQVQTAHRAPDAALHERLASLEGRIIEQERTIRHTLSILIEWIEQDEAQRVAA